MTSTMTLNPPGFKGQQSVNGTLISYNNGAVTVGGIFSSDTVNSGLHAKFGYGVSVDPASPTDFFLGLPSTKTSAIMRGVILADPEIAANAPAKADYYFDNTPITVLLTGVLQFRTWETGVTVSSVTELTTPTLIAVVGFNITTGQISFWPSGTTSVTGYSIVTTAKVVEVDPASGSVRIRFNFV